MKIAILPTFLLCLGQAFAQQTPLAETIRQADNLIRDYRFEEALLVMNSCEDSLDITLLQRKGFCYNKLGNYTDAIIAFESIRSSDSLNREALYNLGQLYANQELYDSSRGYFQKLLELDSTNSYYYKQYAMVCLKANAPLSAMGFLFQSVRLNPRDMDAYGQLANIIIDAGQFHFADSILTEVLTVSENSQLRLLLARAKLGQDDYKGVVENIEHLLLKNDTTASYARLLGISYFQMDEYSKVIPCMRFLVNMGVKSDWVFYYLGVAYQQEGDPVNAIQFLNMAIEEGITDNLGTYYTQLALAYEEVKDFRNAIRNYRFAYETSKTDILLYHLARNYDVYYKDKTQAQIYYKRYLDSDDTVQLAKKYSKYRLEVLSDSSDVR